MGNLRERLSSVLERRFPNNGIAPAHFGDLLAEYAESGLAAPNLLTQLETGDEGKLWSFIWEAMLYRHLTSLGHAPRGSTTAKGQHGPDFCVGHAGRTIWIEAVVPAPEGIAADWLEPPQKGVVRVKAMPDLERVLRCASVIADKRKKFAEYREKGLVGEHDCTIIAVNICRLSDHDIDGNGISRYPLTMEALFPLGPLAVPISPDGNLGAAHNVPRFTLRKATGKDIPGAYFLEAEFASVSSVVQAYQRDMHDKELILATVHNPNALNPLPTGLFGACKEFVAEAHSDHYELRDVRLEARLRELIDSVAARFQRGEDQVVRPATALEAGDFVGESGKCHENVRRWCFVREHFAHMPARGWLITGDGVLDKHSVIDIDGELKEITPMSDCVPRTFLRHDGTEDEFCALPNQLILAR